MTIRQLSSDQMGSSAMMGIIYTKVAFELKHDDRCRFFTVLITDSLGIFGSS